MKITKVEDFIAFQRATAFWELVNALLDKQEFSKDCNLRNQIRRAIDSITANFSEGFEQPTDRAFANFLFTSKGSTAESRKRLAIGLARRYITADEFKTADAAGDEVARLLTGLIKYFRKSERRDRGLGCPSPPADVPSAPPHPTSPPDD